MSELFEKLKRQSEMSDEKVAAFEKAKLLKEEGNDLFKQKLPKKAIRKYHECLMTLGVCRRAFSAVENPENKRDYSAFPPDLADFYKDVDQLKNIVKLNIAACILAQENCLPDYYGNAVKHCDEVLRDEPANAKAWYRKGVGLYLSKNYHQALDILKRVDKSLSGEDTKIKKYIADCHSQLGVGEKQLKERMTKAFGDSAAAANGNISENVKVDGPSESPAD